MGSGSSVGKAEPEAESFTEEHRTSKPHPGNQYLSDSIFGPEPEHYKRLAWLQKEKGDAQDEKWSEDESDQDGPKITIEKDNSASNIYLTHSPGGSAASATASHSPHQHLDPYLVFRSTTSPVDLRLAQSAAKVTMFNRHSTGLPSTSERASPIPRPCRSMIVTRSCSANFIRDTRYLQLSGTATQLVRDLNKIHEELRNSTSERIGDFKKSVLIATPSNSEITAQQFIDRFLPLLAWKPKCFDTLMTLKFDAFLTDSLPPPLRDMPLVTTTVAVLDRLDCVEKLQMDWLPIVKFLMNIEEAYNDVAYHSKYHAADVVGTMGWFISLGWFQKSLSPVHMVISLLAAASHDVDHNGQNNQFHRLAKTKIGVSYPESNMEYHHITKATGIKKIPGCDWTVGIKWKDEEWTEEEVWTLFTSLILRTDPALYDPANRKPFTDLANSTEDELSVAQEPALMEILHLADISNPAKPLGIARKWAVRFYEEFDDLGKEVRRLKLDIPVYTSGKMPTLPDTQVFFIKCMCMPSFKDFIEFEPEAQEAMDHLEQNLVYWIAEGEKKNLELSLKQPERANPSHRQSTSCFCCGRPRGKRQGQSPRSSSSQELKEDDLRGTDSELQRHQDSTPDYRESTDNDMKVTLRDTKATASRDDAKSGSIRIVDDEFTGASKQSGKTEGIVQVANPTSSTEHNEINQLAIGQRKTEEYPLATRKRVSLATEDSDNIK